MDEEIVYLASALLSVLFEYLPWLGAKYNSLADHHQQLIMLGMLVLTVATAFVASCLGLDARYACDQEGFWLAFRDLLAAIAINQGVFKMLPKRK